MPTLLGLTQNIVELYGMEYIRQYLLPPESVEPEVHPATGSTFGHLALAAATVLV